MAANNLIVTVQQDSLTTVSSNLNNPIYLESLSNVGNVDMTTNGVTQGSILVYQTATSKWTSSTTLDAQDMEGGEF
jgi:hypothetical protein